DDHRVAVTDLISGDGAHHDGRVRSLHRLVDQLPGRFIGAGVDIGGILRPKHQLDILSKLLALAAAVGHHGTSLSVEVQTDAWHVAVDGGDLDGACGVLGIVARNAGGETGEKYRRGDRGTGAPV